MYAEMDCLKIDISCIVFVSTVFNKDRHTAKSRTLKHPVNVTSFGNRNDVLEG
jgi:hypothetical protein